MLNCVLCAKPSNQRQFSHVLTCSAKKRRTVTFHLEIYLSCLRKAVNSSFHRLYWNSKKWMAHFCLENGNFAIVLLATTSTTKNKRCRCRLQKSTMQLPNKIRTHNVELSHSSTLVCRLSLLLIWNFYRLHPRCCHFYFTCFSWAQCWYHFV